MNFTNPTTAYTDEVFDRPTNIKSRTVECTHCHYELITDLPGPKCRLCKRYLITVIHDVMASRPGTATQ